MTRKSRNRSEAQKCSQKQKWLCIKRSVSLNGLNKSTLTWRCTIAWRFSLRIIFFYFARRFVVYFLIFALTQNTKSTARCSAILRENGARVCLSLLRFCFFFSTKIYELHYFVVRRLRERILFFLNWTFFGTIILIFFLLSLCVYSMFFYNSLNKYVVWNKIGREEKNCVGNIILK